MTVVFELLWKALSGSDQSLKLSGLCLLGRRYGRPSESLLGEEGDIATAATTTPPTKAPIAPAAAAIQPAPIEDLIQMHGQLTMARNTRQTYLFDARVVVCDSMVLCTASWLATVIVLVVLGAA